VPIDQIPVQRFDATLTVSKGKGNAPPKCGVSCGLVSNRAAAGCAGNAVLSFGMSEEPPAHFNFARNVMDRWARERPEALALWCVEEGGRGEQKLTFAQLAENSRRAASLFSGLGLARGDRVLIILPRVPRWWI